MAALSICTASDVIQRAGGQDVLVRLIPDPESPGSYNTTLLSTLIGSAGEWIAARGNVQVDIEAIRAAIAAGTLSEWPPYLVDIVAWLTVARCWDAGGQGQAKPDYVVRWEQQIVSVECEKLRRREISLGAPQTYPGTNQAIRVVDPDPNRNRLMRDGFRSRGGLG